MREFTQNQLFITLCSYTNISQSCIYTYIYFHCFLHCTISHNYVYIIVFFFLHCTTHQKFRNMCIYIYIFLFFFKFFFKFFFLANNIMKLFTVWVMMFPTWIISCVINPTEGGKRESRFNVQFGSFGCLCTGGVSGMGY